MNRNMLTDEWTSRQVQATDSLTKRRWQAHIKKHGNINRHCKKELVSMVVLILAGLMRKLGTGV